MFTFSDNLMTDANAFLPKLHNLPGTFYTDIDQGPFSFFYFSLLFYPCFNINGAYAGNTFFSETPVPVECMYIMSVGVWLCG